MFNKNFVSYIQKYLLCFLLLFVGCNTHNNDKTATLISIEIAPLEAHIYIDETQQFTAIGTYSDKSTRDITSSVIWESSNPEIATIESMTGLSTGLGAGSAQIMAILNNIHSNAATVHVMPQTQEPQEPKIVKVNITASASKIFVHNSLQFSAVATFSDNSTRDITNEVKWQSSDITVATISPAGVTTGVSQGEIQISASLNSIISNIFILQIQETPAPQITQIEIFLDSDEIYIAETQQFKAIATFSDQTHEDVTNKVKWKSSNPNIATINESNGLAKGVQIGTTEISASLGITLSQKILFKVRPHGLNFSIIDGSCRKTDYPGNGGNINIRLLNNDSETYDCYVAALLLNESGNCQNGHFWSLPPKTTTKTINCSGFPTPATGTRFGVTVYCTNKYLEVSQQTVFGSCSG